MARLPIFTDSKLSPKLIITFHLQKKDKENADSVDIVLIALSFV